MYSEFIFLLFFIGPWFKRVHDDLSSLSHKSIVSYSLTRAHSTCKYIY